MSLTMKRLACCLVSISLALAACGDNRPGAGIDASIDSLPADMGIDSDIDAMIDAMPTPAEAIAAVRAAPDTPDGQMIALPVIDATVTYLKPLIAGSSPANDSASFTVQVGATGPALLVAVDPATLTTLTPALAVGDVVSFTVTVKDSSGSSPRATAITNITRSATGTSVAGLAQDITAVTGIAAMIADFDSELVDVTSATIAQAWGGSGSAFSRTRITTTGQPTVDDNFQLRLPTAFKDALEASSDLEVGCVVAIQRTPVNRFAAQFQVSAFDTTDLTITSCPTPTVATAAATTSTTVTVQFSRNIDTASVLTDGTQFTIVDDATPTPNALVVTAAALTSADTVTLTTAAQTTGTNYTVTVANTVEDVIGAPIGAPNSATFTGFTIPIPTVMMAAAPNATTVDVTFTRAIDMATVTADGSQFTITETATPANTLAVSAATVSGMVVTLTTAAQTPGMMYTVTVVNTVEDTDGTPVGAPLTASFLGFTPAAAVDHLVINEVDYDQAGTDANTFIEIYNPTNAAIPLANFAVVYLNGGSTGGPTASSYGTRVMLSSAGTELAAGGYLLIRNSTVAANGALTIDVAGDFLQNGADGIALIDTSTNTLVDALHYAHLADGVGAGITMATITGFAATVSLVEGSVFATADTTTGSLGRFPNGADTNNASVDWSLRATPSPGMTN
jgi:hypothetical protein